MKGTCYLIDCQYCSWEGFRAQNEPPKLCPKCGSGQIKITAHPAFYFKCETCGAPSIILDCIEADSGQIKDPYCCECGA